MRANAVTARSISPASRTLNCDCPRLTQVLLNLVGNAIKFTDAGEVSIAAGARNSHFAVSVTDTGPGIPLDQQDRIFEQFHPVDSTMTKAKGGTGLDLAIAKQIVEMQGGPDLGGVDARQRIDVSDRSSPRAPSSESPSRAAWGRKRHEGAPLGEGVPSSKENPAA